MGNNKVTYLGNDYSIAKIIREIKIEFDLPQSAAVSELKNKEDARDSFDAVGINITECETWESVAEKLGSAHSVMADEVRYRVWQDDRFAMKPEEFEITEGYVGRMGIVYQTATEDALNDAISKAAQRNEQSVEQIKAALLNGEKVAWRNSPNYYYDHSTGYIRQKRTTKPEQLIKCSCGHSVPQSQVMSASQGSSCLDCYDRMSN